MGVNASSNIGLDASVTQGLIKSIGELNRKGNYAMSGVSTLALPEFAALDGFRHTGKACVGIPASVIVAGGRLAGINAAKKSDYSVRKEALHVVRAMAYFASAIGHAILLLSLASLIKPTLGEKLNSVLKLDASWEKASKAPGFIQRSADQIAKACMGTKKFVSLVVSNKDPKLTRKVVGAGVGLVALLGAGAWLLSGAEKTNQPLPEPGKSVTEILKDNLPLDNPLKEDTKANGWIEAAIVVTGFVLCGAIVRHISKGKGSDLGKLRRKKAFQPKN
ncbi:MAG: hypothetical protein Q8K75_08160 [Chlamydiales bacterium]|nr:hypothetical protein [Chlamydiales bacterium]